MVWTKEEVLEEVAFQKKALGTELDDDALQDVSGYVFYNTSKWTLKKLYDTATNSQQILQSNFQDYLNGFSANVQEIINKFNYYYVTYISSTWLLLVIHIHLL